MTLFGLDGRVCLVTGASSGIGSRMAVALHEAGATVVLLARRADRVEQLAAELGSRASAVAADVTNPEQLRAAVATACERHGGLDVMVNNAGTVQVGAAESESLEGFDQVIGVNLVALFHGCQEAGKVMLAAGRGSIINVASVYGLVGSGRVPQASYAASKGGVVNLTRELASQWATRGVRVNTLAPGWFPSEMTAPMFDERGLRFIERTVPMKRAGREDELDGPIVFLASDASSYMTGQTLVVDGGLTAI
jgi:NAD(P)-dependent dehydrogenase (short-subunit alcohol dehydrogenase family)